MDQSGSWQEAELNSDGSNTEPLRKRVPAEVEQGYGNQRRVLRHGDCSLGNHCPPRAEGTRGGSRECLLVGAGVTGGCCDSQQCGTKSGRESGKSISLPLFSPLISCLCLWLTKPRGSQRARESEDARWISLSGHKQVRGWREWVEVGN